MSTPFVYGDKTYMKSQTCPINKDIGWLFILLFWIPLVNVLLFGFILGSWKKAILRLVFYLFGGVGLAIGFFAGALLLPENPFVIWIITIVIIVGIQIFFMGENLYIGFTLLSKDESRFKMESKYVSDDKKCFIPTTQVAEQIKK